MTELSVVITTFNSSSFIKSCLNSIYNQDYKDFETIIVDNGSCDDTVSIIRENYPHIILIENQKNCGACRARNQGIQIARSQWILILDCDVILGNDFLQEIIKCAKVSDELIGMFQPKVLSMDKKSIYSCGIYLSHLRRFYDIGKGEVDNEKFDREKNIFGVCSAAALYKKKMLEDIKEETGYFDEHFFFLVEDVDVAWRAQKRGWKALFFPKAVCFHIGNSSKTDKKLRQYLCLRNRYYTIIKNEGVKKYLVRLFPVVFYDFPRLLYMLFTNHYIYTGFRKNNHAC